MSKADCFLQSQLTPTFFGGGSRPVCLCLDLPLHHLLDKNDKTANIQQY